jgi:hypothetical protein
MVFPAMSETGRYDNPIVWHKQAGFSACLFVLIFEITGFGVMHKACEAPLRHRSSTV